MGNASSELATLAGGCFWCLEAVFEELRGVQRVVSGYAGGDMTNPTYEQVCTGTTGHAEVVQITFDPAVVSYRELLEVFFTIHDPTTPNRQGPDAGTQYRSAIFTHSSAQEAEARKVIADLTAKQLWDAPVVTEIKPLTAFYPAEEYHQHYFARNPTQGYCRMIVAPKVAKFRKLFVGKLIATLLLLVVPALLPAQETPLDTNWVRTEARIGVRDGAKLYVTVLRDRRQAGPLPIIMGRTPYEADAEWKHGWPTPEFRDLADDGYIFVFEDIRGRYKSEGQFAMTRPLHDPADRNGTDESTDAWDTIEWLVHNVPNNNGRVGIMGISYDGWLAVMASVGAHPALKAASPQAPPADLWMGDDFFHNGAFRLSMGLEYSVMMETSNEIVPFDVGAYDMYEWYLRLGPLSNMAAHAFPGGRPTWNNFVRHPAYDAYWRDQAMTRVLHAPTVPTLTVGGWWDQEDRFGALETYRTLERFDTAGINRIAMGPWNHGGWAGPLGQRLGNLNFGAPTAQWFRANVETPFFAFYLKDRGPLTVAEATMFETGSNTWRTFNAWPPREAAPRELYLRENGTLAFDAPPAAAAAFDSYVSDPAHPVPYRPRPVQPTYYRGGSDWYTWETMDQRFVDGRPDVLVWTSDTLTSDVVIAGDVTAHLFASTTGSDADWVVKLIDVLPAVDTANQRMGGYELMVAYEIFRGRYRSSFEHPHPIAPNTVVEYTIGLHQQSYRFRRGHRLMVQVQSTWFPLYDRNPQTFVPNIFEAKAADYRPATQRIWRTARYPSHVTIPVIPN